MKLITAIVKPFKLEEVREALRLEVARHLQQLVDVRQRLFSLLRSDHRSAPSGPFQESAHQDLHGDAACHGAVVGDRLDGAAQSFMRSGIARPALGPCPEAVLLPDLRKLRHAIEFGVRYAEEGGTENAQQRHIVA